MPCDDHTGMEEEREAILEVESVKVAKEVAREFVGLHLFGEELAEREV